MDGLAIQTRDAGRAQDPGQAPVSQNHRGYRTNPSAGSVRQPVFRRARGFRSFLPVALSAFHASERTLSMKLHSSSSNLAFGSLLIREEASLRNLANPDSPPPYFRANGVATNRKNVLSRVANSACSDLRSLLAPAASHFSSAARAFKDVSRQHLRLAVAQVQSQADHLSASRVYRIVMDRPARPQD